jgi:hypothetical protein
MKVIAAILGMLISVAIFTACTIQSSAPHQPIVLMDKGIVLKAGQVWDIAVTNTSTYNVQIRSGDAVTIRTYATSKDLELAHAGSNKAELVPGCNADQSTLYNENCALPQGSVIEIKNPNFLQSIEVVVKVISP